MAPTAGVVLHADANAIGPAGLDRGGRDRDPAVEGGQFVRLPDGIPFELPRLVGIVGRRVRISDLGNPPLHSTKRMVALRIGERRGLEGQPVGWITRKPQVGHRGSAGDGAGVAFGIGKLIEHGRLPAVGNAAAGPRPADESELLHVVQLPGQCIGVPVVRAGGRRSVFPAIVVGLPELHDRLGHTVDPRLDDLWLEDQIADLANRVAILDLHPRFVADGVLGPVLSRVPRGSPTGIGIEGQIPEPSQRVLLGRLEVP